MALLLTPTTAFLGIPHDAVGLESWVHVQGNRAVSARCFQIEAKAVGMVAHEAGNEDLLARLQAALANRKAVVRSLLGFEIK